MGRPSHLLLALALALGLSLALAAPAFAQTRSLEEGPIVRRQLLYRSDRLELNPALGHTLNDPYRRTLFLDVAANYHLTNTFSLGINVAWGALHYNTGLLDEIERVNPQRARELRFAETTLLTNFHLGYVPFYGKFNFLDLGSVDWDFHLIGGIGGALLSSRQPSDLEGFKFGPAFGGGFRFFWSGDMALSINVIDYMFSTAAVARHGQSPEEEFTHNVLVSIGVSFFVTGNLRVSR
jgi:outer membrane beta-barrel protein